MIRLTCRQASRLLSDAEDHPLATSFRLRLRLHLLACQNCRNFRDQLGFMRRAARGQKLGE
ncbi:zf-HC2 domain-containing protein [Burkholderiaceae bacterium DAT-1]|nr:zf-HC2 domain-containing protein [Burkholderiaceae bacterium DAT-1]